MQAVRAESTRTVNDDRDERLLIGVDVDNPLITITAEYMGGPNDGAEAWVFQCSADYARRMARALHQAAHLVDPIH